MLDTLKDAGCSFTDSRKILRKEEIGLQQSTERIGSLLSILGSVVTTLLEGRNLMILLLQHIFPPFFLIKLT